MAKKTTARIQKWTKDLSSPIEEVIFSTIDAIAEKGDIRLVKPLLLCAKEHGPGQVRAKIENMLSDVKDKRLGDELFSALADEAFSTIRPTILALLWNASVPLTGNLEQLVKLSCEGEFEEQFEVVTVLENYGGEFEEEEIMNALIDMREHLRAQGGGTALQQQVLQILQVLERFD